MDKKKIFKYILLEVLLLIVLCLISVLITKIFDLVLNLQYTNIWTISLKIGILSWIILLVTSIIRIKIKNKK